MKDHQMGYAPAAREFYRAPREHEYEGIESWPCGMPRRAEDEAMRRWGEYRARRNTHTLNMMVVVDGCMTKGDVNTLYGCTHGDALQARLEHEGTQIGSQVAEMTAQLHNQMARAYKTDPKIVEADRHAIEQERRYAAMGRCLR